MNTNIRILTLISIASIWFIAGYVRGSDELKRAERAVNRCQSVIMHNKGAIDG